MDQVSLVVEMDHANLLLQFLSFFVAPFLDLVFIDPMNEKLTPIGQERYRADSGGSSNHIAINVRGKIDQDFVTPGCNVLGNSNPSVGWVGHIRDIVGSHLVPERHFIYKFGEDIDQSRSIYDRRKAHVRPHVIGLVAKTFLRLFTLAHFLLFAASRFPDRLPHTLLLADTFRLQPSMENVLSLVFRSFTPLLPTLRIASSAILLTGRTGALLFKVEQAQASLGSLECWPLVLCKENVAVHLTNTHIHVSSPRIYVIPKPFERSVGGQIGIAGINCLEIFVNKRSMDLPVALCTIEHRHSVGYVIELP
mmetsp:Transcript_5398/g.15289  ORF Transcript_5398/g.15289 Transcript_5398/m.15289 type:complete len:308 (-) Transcript_5398:327-1250(-)